MNPRKSENGLRVIGARIPYTLLSGHEDNDVPAFWLLLLLASIIEYRRLQPPEPRRRSFCASCPGEAVETWTSEGLGLPNETRKAKNPS